MKEFGGIKIFLNPLTKEFRGLVHGSRQTIFLGGSLQIIPKSKGEGFIKVICLSKKLSRKELLPEYFLKSYFFDHGNLAESL